MLTLSQLVRNAVISLGGLGHMSQRAWGRIVSPETTWTENRRWMNFQMKAGTVPTGRESGNWVWQRARASIRGADTPKQPRLLKWCWLRGRHRTESGCRARKGEERGGREARRCAQQSLCHWGTRCLTFCLGRHVCVHGTCQDVINGSFLLSLEIESEFFPLLYSGQLLQMNSDHYMRLIGIWWLGPNKQSLSSGFR